MSAAAASATTLVYRNIPVPVHQYVQRRRHHPGTVFWHVTDSAVDYCSNLFSLLLDLQSTDFNKAPNNLQMSIVKAVTVHKSMPIVLA